MARKAFNTSVEEEIVAQFKNTCRNYGIDMNVVLELLMQEFVNNNFVLTLRDGKFSVSIKEMQDNNMRQ